MMSERLLFRIVEKECLADVESGDNAALIICDS